MRIRSVIRMVLPLLVVFAAAFLAAQTGANDPLSGTWTGDWGPTPTHRNPVVVALKWDGKTLTGEVNPGPAAVALKNATFDAKTAAVHFEADAKGRRGNDVHYVIDGKVEQDKMSGSWSHDDRKGDFSIKKQK